MFFGLNLPCAGRPQAPVLVCALTPRRLGIRVGVGRRPVIEVELNVRDILDAVDGSFFVEEEGQAIICQRAPNDVGSGRQNGGV
jgi:hypothetical protein